MSHLGLRLPNFGDIYNQRQMRDLVRQLEQAFARVDVDAHYGAYTTTANATLDKMDEVVLVDTSGGDVTITLPEISDDMVRDRREYETVKTTAAGTLTVAPTGSDTIMGAADAVVTVQWTALRFRATTGNWVLV